MELLVYSGRILRAEEPHEDGSEGRGQCVYGTFPSMETVLLHWSDAGSHLLACGYLSCRLCLALTCLFSLGSSLQDLQLRWEVSSPQAYVCPRSKRPVP